MTRRRIPAAPRGTRGWMRAGALAACALLLAGALRQERRERVVDRVVEEALPPPVHLIRTPRLARGWEVILEEGQPGLAIALVRERRRGTGPVVRETVERRLARAPRREVRLTGIAPLANPVTAPRLTRVVKTHRVVATAYDPGPIDNGWANAGITKLGWRTRKGIAAVDPSVIPLRTLLYVEGYGLAWAGDVGGAIKGDRVDLCFNRTEEALAWGRRRTRAWVLRGVPD